MTNLTVAPMPYFGVMIAPERRWLRSLELADVVADFCATRDDCGYGASDLGGRLPLYRMSVDGRSRRAVGYVKYNGDVALTEAP